MAAPACDIVHGRLPEAVLTADSKDVVKLGVALIATLSVLALSLLISSAKPTFDTRSNQLLEHMGSSIPVPFLVILVFWLCIIFASFGLFAPRNATVIAVFGVSALSVAGAIFLIIEFERSFEGLLQVSGAPMRAALAQLGR